MRLIALFSLLLLAACERPAAEVPSERAREIAAYSRATYADAAIATLADLLAFRTVHQEGIENADNPDFQAQTAYLQRLAADLGLDFADHGAVVVIGLGEAQDRLGIVTHGDLQPADPSKWAQDPFSLDTLSEPGRLIGRGVEDDKGPIAAALYAMKAVKDQDLPLRRRVELIISLTEESDWQLFMEYLEHNQPPELNVTLDSEYPLVIAENGWNSIMLSLPPTGDASSDAPRLVSLTGGAFLSQIPEDATAVIANPTPELVARLQDAATQHPEITYTFERSADSLTVLARGVAAHSSKPWEGRNAITHLAALLAAHDWRDSQAARMVQLINDLVGTGDYAEKFGDVAHTHPFMGRLTLSLTTLGYEEENLVAGINIRSPAGRSPEQLEGLLRETVAGWKERTGFSDVTERIFTSAPYYLEDAPHIPVLLAIFAHYTGQPDAQPISIGGGTHARLMPNGLNFGPAMPGEPYTGHSEHEYMRREVFLLTLEMYTAMLVELAGR